MYVLFPITRPRSWYHKRGLLEPWERRLLHGT